MWGRRCGLHQSRHMSARAFLDKLWGDAQAGHQRIVLPEAQDERVLRAAAEIEREGLARVTLLGCPDDIRRRMNELQLDYRGLEIVDNNTCARREKYAAVMHEKRKEKGLTIEEAYDALADTPVFGTMMVACGDLDGMVSGACHTSADTIRPALQLVGREEDGIVSSLMFMLLEDRVVVYADCALQVKPSSEELACIATSSAATSSHFGVDPNVAMLSYATGMSNEGPQVSHVRKAVEIAETLLKNLGGEGDQAGRNGGGGHPVPISGPIQYDAAFCFNIAKQKGVQRAGDTSVFVFPDLNCGNITYKAVQQSTGCMVLGPVLQGLRRPINDLSRGCSVADIVSTVAVTSIQAMHTHHTAQAA